MTDTAKPAKPNPHGFEFEDPRIAKTVAAIEASSYESLCIWREYHDERGLPWTQDSSGKMVTIGQVAGRPVVISMFWAAVGRNQRLVMFWELTGTLADFKLADRIGGWVRAASEEETGEEFGTEVFVPAAEWAVLWAKHLADNEMCRLERLAEAPRLHLFCPSCGQRHVDEGASLELLHEDHDCAFCGHRWAVAAPRPENAWNLSRAIACFGKAAPDEPMERERAVELLRGSLDLFPVEHRDVLLRSLERFHEVQPIFGEGALPILNRLGIPYRHFGHPDLPADTKAYALLIKSPAHAIPPQIAD